MQTAPRYQADVTIIGAGPVGLSIANLLALRGVSVNLIETLPELIDYPRGVGIDDESLRSLQTMGLIAAALPHTTPNHIMRLVNGRGRILAEIAPTIDEFGWSRRSAFIQPAIDRVLFEGLDRFAHARVWFEHTMTGISEGADGVEVRAQTPDGAEAIFESKFLVGADGGRSETRKHTGVAFDGQSPSTRWLVIDMENDPLGVPNVWVGGDPKRPYVSLALPHGLRRFEFMLFDGEDDSLIEHDEFIASLLRPHLRAAEHLKILRRRVYTHHSRIVSDFRSGRIFLAGDAAHLMPVWQGQGWNSGMRDATNLAWKLADVVSGRCSEALLDSYNSERHGHAKAMIDISVAFGRFVKPTNRLIAALRDGAVALLGLVPGIKQYFVQMKYKPMPRYERGVVVDPSTMQAGLAGAALHGTTAVFKSYRKQPSPVGTQFIQPRVCTIDREEKLLDDAIGYRWAVLVWGGDPRSHLDEQHLGIVERLDAVLIAIVPMTQLPERQPWPDVVVLGDQHGRLKRWFDTRPTAAVLLRPDRFVAAAGAPQDLGLMLEAAAQAAHLEAAGQRVEAGA